MPSPPRPPRGSPPRRALHERTESQTNERSIRMIGDPQAPVYGSPFPTKPSQILSPIEQRPNIGAEPGVSHPQDPPRETNPDTEYFSKSRSSPKNTKTSYSTLPNDGLITRQSNRPLYGSSSDASGRTPSTSLLAMEQPAEEGGRASDDIVQLPSVPLTNRASGAHTATTAGPPNIIQRQAIQEKDSESSLSSTNSSGTVIVRKNRDGKKRASYSAFPSVVRPSSSRSNSSPSTPQRATSDEPSDQHAPLSSVYPISPISPPIAASAEHRASSVPTYTSMQNTSQGLVNLKYPVIRPPSASASWVEPPDFVEHKPQPVIEHNHRRWNPHLSTVQSEGTVSPSEGSSDQTMGLPDSSRVSKSSSMAPHGRESSDLPTTHGPPPPPAPPPESSIQSSMPILTPVHRRDFTGSTIRVVTEQEDTLPKLQSIPGSRGSEHLDVPSASEGNRNNGITRPSSRASFFRDSIPAWARVYYARPHSSSSAIKNGRPSRPSTSTENSSFNVFRPRTRNNQEADGQAKRSSLAISPIRPREVDHTEFRGPPRRKVSPDWSPHLWHDRITLGRRRTIFQAPSIDEEAEGKAPSRRNAQVLLFIVGFIFPPGWFLASFLPLPPRPVMYTVKGKHVAAQTQVVEDLEKRLGPIDEARYENARWWRNINRILSLVGIVIVVAVITIAAVTAK